MRITTLLFILTSLLVSACNSVEKRTQEFEIVEIGMVKAEVLEVAGPPYWSDRKHGFDRWIYYMKPRSKQVEKIIYFQNGKVVRKGYRDKPVLTAEEMEEIKKSRSSAKAHKPSVSDEELRKIIKKEIKKNSKTKPKKQFERI